MTNMKKTIINYLLAAGVILGMASCQKSVIEPLEGVFAAPVTVNATELVSSSVEKLEGKRNFAIELSAGADKVSMVLVANNYFLLGNTYSPADEAAAKNGNYIVGKTTVNGKVVESGSIIVTKSGDAKIYEETDTYTFDAMLFCEDGVAYHVLWSGNLVYEYDPEPVLLTKVLGTMPNAFVTGAPSLTLYLATSDVNSFAFDWNTRGFLATGSGNVLAVDLYSADTKLHEGTYTASATNTGVPAAGEFATTYTLWNFAQNFGTCWWSVEKDSPTPQTITTGKVVVSKTEKGWKIEFTSGEGRSMISAVYEGAIQGV